MVAIETYDSASLPAPDRRCVSDSKVESIQHITDSLRVDCLEMSKQPESGKDNDAKKPFPVFTHTQSIVTCPKCHGSRPLIAPFEGMEARILNGKCGISGCDQVGGHVKSMHTWSYTHMCNTCGQTDTEPASAVCCSKTGKPSMLPAED